VLRQNTEPGAVGTAGIVLMTFRDLRNVPSVGASVARPGPTSHGRSTGTAVSDRTTLEGLTQFLTRSPDPCLQTVEDEPHRGTVESSRSVLRFRPLATR
jgi:hypothetical protein